MPIPSSGIGFNFRSTVGYVTDGTREFFVDAATAYPVTFGSSPDDVAAGWVSLSGLDERDRSTSVDRRLAGMVFLDSVSAYQDFRVDVPAGTYSIRVALTDQGANNSKPVLTVRDGVGGTVLATVSNGTLLTFPAVRDATGADRTDAAAWVSGNAAITVTTTGGVLSFRLGPVPASPDQGNHLAHIQIVPAGPAFTAPAPATNYSGAQGTTVPIPSGAFNRNGNTNTLTVRVNGTLPTGVTLASANVTNPTSTFAVDLVIAGSAPLVTADPFTLELVDGATVVATLALTVTVTAAASTTAGGASNATTELSSGIVLFDLFDSGGAPLTTASPTIRVAGVGSDTFNNRTAVYRGEPGRYRYTLTTLERPTTGMATIISPTNEGIYVAVVEDGTMFNAVTSFSQRFAQLAQGVIVATIPQAVDGRDGVRAAPLFNDLVVDVPVWIFGTGKTIRCRVCEFPEGDPAAIGSLELTALTESGSLYTGTFNRLTWNAAVSPTYIDRTLWIHYDDGGDRHYVRAIRVVEFIALGV